MCFKCPIIRSLFLPKPSQTKHLLLSYKLKRLISKENRAAASPPTTSVKLVPPEADKTVKLEAECGDILLESKGQQTDNRRRGAREGAQSGAN